MQPHEPNLGFVPWVVVQTGLPHSRQTNHDGSEATEYERVNGRARLVMTARRKVGLPYGRVPRLILAHLVRQYRIQAMSMPSEQARTLDLGQSTASFLRRCGMSSTGGKHGTLRRFRSQLNRLTRCDIVDEGGTTADTDCFTRVAVADRMQLWWNADPPEGTIPLFPSYIRLSEGFARSLEGAVPVDMTTMAQLRSVMAMDLYVWLSFRAGGLFDRRDQAVEISWHALAQQFGHGYSRERAFRAAFRRHLKSVIDVYPVRVGQTPRGILVHPYPSHIARLR